MNNQINNKLSKNIGIDFVYSFFKYFSISEAIWVLYLVYKGLTLWQIGIIEGIYHATGLIFEIPSGAAADLLGRKRVIVIGRILSAVSSIIMLLSTQVWQFAVAFVISSLSNNLNSGSEEALVYDSFKLSGKEAAYLRFNSRLNVLIEITQALATFVGGVVAELSFSYCYIISVLVSIISVIIALCFTEPDINNKRDNESISLKEHFITCYKVLKENKSIRKILLYFPTIFAFHTVLFFYGQQYFSNLGLNKIQISLVMLLAGFISCIGAICCKYLLDIFKDKTVYIASLLMCFGIIGMVQLNIVSAIIFFSLSNFANALLYPIQSNSLNKLIPSEQRATIISVESMLFSLTMIIIFPIAGALAGFIRLNYTFLLLGVLQLLFILKVKF